MRLEVAGGSGKLTRVAVEEILIALYLKRWQEEHNANISSRTCLVGLEKGISFEIWLIFEKKDKWLIINRKDVVIIELHSRIFPNPLEYPSEDHQSLIARLEEILAENGAQKLMTEEKEVRPKDKFTTRIQKWQISSLWRPPKFKPPQIDS